MKERAINFFNKARKAFVGGATAGAGTALAVAVNGPGADDLETYAWGVVAAFVGGFLTYWTTNRPQPARPPA